MKRTLLFSLFMLAATGLAWAGDGTMAAGYSLPKEWKKVKYPRHESLPDAVIQQGTATLRARVLGYRADAPMSLHVEGFMPIGSDRWFHEQYPIDPDGTVTARVPLDMTRQVKVAIVPDGEHADDDDLLYQNRIILAPGQETEVLINLVKAGSPFQAFRGYMGRTNRELAEHYFALTANRKQDAQRLCGEIAELQTPEQRLQFFRQRLLSEKRRIDKSRLTEASRAILRMEAEGDYVDWVTAFEQQYLWHLITAGLMKQPQPDEYRAVVDDLHCLLPQEVQDTVTLLPADFETLTRPYAPVSPVFWDFCLVGGEGTHPYTTDLLYTQTAVRSGWGPHYEHFANSVKSEDCRAILRDYAARRQQVGDELARRSNVFLHAIDSVSGDDVLPALLSRYPDRPVLMELWATWDGASHEAHRKMIPLCEYLMEQGVAVVSVVDDTSNLQDWNEMLRSTPGDHYRLTREQFRVLLRFAPEDGVPAYLLFGPDHSSAVFYVGFPGTETIRRQFANILGTGIIHRDPAK